MISNSGKNTIAKIDMAIAIKAEKGISVDSPGAQRVGGNHGEGDGNQLLQEIHAEKSMVKKAQMLSDLKSLRRDLWNSYDPSVE